MPKDDFDQEDPFELVGMVLPGPQDDASFELARRVKPDVYQIDPAMLADLDLVRRIGRERKPVLVVAAGATAATIAGVIQALGRCPIVLLHSVMADVVAPRRARLQYIGWLSERFHAPAGYLGSAAFAQVLADALGKPVASARVAESSALGAALCAGVGAGLYRGLDEAARSLAATRETHEPDASRGRVLEQRYAAWNRLRSAQPDAAELELRST